MTACFTQLFYSPFGELEMLQQVIRLANCLFTVLCERERQNPVFLLHAGFLQPVWRADDAAADDWAGRLCICSIVQMQKTPPGLLASCRFSTASLES